MQDHYQVAVIGAGPSGTCVASLLKSYGLSVAILERSHFPRFSIGESLLPQCIDDLNRAGLLKNLAQDRYQFKNGAAFLRGSEYSDFDFSQKFSEGCGHAFQVKRSIFDKDLADQCEAKGIPIFYGYQVNQVQTTSDGKSTLQLQDLNSQQECSLSADFVVDASGFGRVLPRLFQLDRPVDSPKRFSLFTHVKENNSTRMDRNKILIVGHPVRSDMWFWLIPFADGTLSMGVVGSAEVLSPNKSNEQMMSEFIKECPQILERLDFFNFEHGDVQKIEGYACGVSQLYGAGYVLLGNAGEFIDPVFSSGVTIACRSACLAAPLIAKQLEGRPVDWEMEFKKPLSEGIDVFRSFVNLWYTGRLMDIFLANESNQSLKKMICSVLAGFAWDKENPMVKNTNRRLEALCEWVELSRSDAAALQSH